MLEDFVRTTWTLLTTTGLGPKYDIVLFSQDILTVACQQSYRTIDVGRKSRTTFTYVQQRRCPPRNRRKDHPTQYDNAKYLPHFYILTKPPTLSSLKTIP